jgi:hypothetical protein
MAEGTEAGPPAAERWTGYTPAGQLLVVERDHDVWVVTCEDQDPVRHRVLDVALITAVRGDVEAHSWRGVDPAAWTRLIADSIIARSSRSLRRLQRRKT